MGIDNAYSEFFGFEGNPIIILEYRGIPHFSAKIFFQIFEYFFNKYMVIDNAHPEFLGFKSIRL